MTTIDRPRLFVAAALAVALTGCTAPLAGPNVRSGSDAYAAMPAATPDFAGRDYQIGPLDSIDITVFQEPDISQKGILVDAAGNIFLPLLGRVKASEKTTTELALYLTQQLSHKFYVNPQVTVAVASSVSQRVTVQGQVTEPGVYQIRGETTLLDAVALAKGETENASLRQVVVIRFVNGERTAALFDLEKIRRGDEPDPAVFGRDVIVVGHSNSKQAWHDLLRAAPLLGVFTRF